MPLYKVQIDWSRSSLSPKVYGNGGPFEIADATADLRKSMAQEEMIIESKEGFVEMACELHVGVCAVGFSSLPIVCGALRPLLHSTRTSTFSDLENMRL